MVDGMDLVDDVDAEKTHLRGGGRPLCPERPLGPLLGQTPLAPIAESRINVQRRLATPGCRSQEGSPRTRADDSGAIRSNAIASAPHPAVSPTRQGHQHFQRVLCIRRHVAYNDDYENGYRL